MAELQRQDSPTQAALITKSAPHAGERGSLLDTS
jgi:hypothetical protein